MQLDRTLAALFEFVDSHVGLANTLIVLSADHGGPDAPGYLKSLKIPSGYIEPENWNKQAAITRIKDRFQIEGQLIEKYAHPYVYLSADVIENKNIDREALEAADRKSVV